MNDDKLKKLFAAARGEAPPELSSNFAQRVMGALRREAAPRPSFSLADQLSALFPRLAAVSFVIIVLSVAGEFYFRNAEAAAVNYDVNQLTEAMLVTENSE